MANIITAAEKSSARGPQDRAGRLTQNIFAIFRRHWHTGRPVHIDAVRFEIEATARDEIADAQREAIEEFRSSRCE